MSSGDAASVLPVAQLKIVWTEKVYGGFHCYIQGNLEHSKVVCITYHDIGLNHSSFVKFLSTKDMASVASKLCFVHINAPGQQDDAENLADNYQYPSMQQLAEVIPAILKECGVTENHDIIGFGEGAGANILVRYSITNPQQVLALILLECTSTAAGFMEWGQEKVATWNLSHRGMNPTAEKYILWHHLGNYTKDKLHVVEAYHKNLYERINAHNLAFFIDQFRNRTNITSHLKDLKAPVLVITGEHSPHHKDVQKFYKHLKAPSSRVNNNLLIAESVGGDIKEENPQKLAESVTFFLQGVGLLSGIAPLRLHLQAVLGETSTKPRSGSMSEYDQPHPHIH